MDLLIYLTSDIDECSSFYGCQEKCIKTVSDYTIAHAQKDTG